MECTETLNSWVSFSFIWQWHGFSSLIVVFLNHRNESFSQFSITCNTPIWGRWGNVCIAPAHIPGIMCTGSDQRRGLWRKKFELKEHFISHTSPELSLKSQRSLLDFLPYFCRLQRPGEASSKLACVWMNSTISFLKDSEEQVISELLEALVWIHSYNTELHHVWIKKCLW